MQEVLIKIWRGINRLQNPFAFKAWLNQIVANLFYDELRKRPRHVTVISLDQSSDGEDGQERPTREIEDDAPGPEEIYHRKEFDSAVYDVMKLLPNQFKTVIVLRELEGLSYDEIALLTGSDLGTVKSRISRARTKLQTLLNPYLNADDISSAA
jgi:RNA polymerase sigma-70 factor (ECF subfamily)